MQTLNNRMPHHANIRTVVSKALHPREQPCPSNKFQSPPLKITALFYHIVKMCINSSSSSLSLLLGLLFWRYSRSCFVDIFKFSKASFKKGGKEWQRCYRGAIQKKKKLFSVSLKQFQVTAVIAKTFHLVSVCSAIWPQLVAAVWSYPADTKTWSGRLLFSVLLPINT